MERREISGSHLLHVGSRASPSGPGQEYNVLLHSHMYIKNGIIFSVRVVVVWALSWLTGSHRLDIRVLENEFVVGLGFLY